MSLEHKQSVEDVIRYIENSDSVELAGEILGLLSRLETAEFLNETNGREVDRLKKEREQRTNELT